MNQTATGQQLVPNSTYDVFPPLDKDQPYAVLYQGLTLPLPLLLFKQTPQGQIVFTGQMPATVHYPCHMSQQSDRRRRQQLCSHCARPPLCARAGPPAVASRRI